MAKAVAIIPVGHDFPPFSASKGGAVDGSKIYLLAFDLAFQNEFAAGWLDGVPRVTTPDLICVLDTVPGDAIATATLAVGDVLQVGTVVLELVHA